MPGVSSRTTATALLFLCGVASTGSAGAPLPDGFGGIPAGAAWAEVESKLDPQALDIRLTDQDRRAHACGYREARVRARNATLHLIAHDFVVTEMHYTTPLRAGSAPADVAALVRKTYGVPRAEQRRDALGTAVDAGTPSAHVTLDYENEHPVRFSASGAPLWRYQVSVTFRDRVLHENRTRRCIRLPPGQRAPEGG